MTKLNIVNDVIKKALKLGATDVDAIIVDSLSIGAEVRLGNVVNIERSEDMALGIRVIINGSQAIVSTSDLSNASLDKMIERSIDMAKVTPSNPHIFLANSDQISTEIKDLELYDSQEPSAESLIEKAKIMEQSSLSNKLITNSNGSSAGYGSNQIYFATSKGFSHSYKTSASSLSVSVLAGKDESMQSDYAYSQARFAQDLKTPEELGLEAEERVLKKLNPKKIATCEIPVIFDYRMARRILAAFASGVNGSSISRGTSFLVDHMGKKIFNQNVNIIDDPFIIRGQGSRPFDAEGIAGSKLNIIENGILNHYFLDLQTASKLNMQTTARAIRGLSSSPSSGCTNLYIEAGNSSLEEMIKSIKKGLLITEVFGHGANIVTGDYSQGAGGFLIENGEITSPVSEITIASNLKEIFANMIPASDLRFDSSINSPSLFIEKMTVAGV